MRIVYIDIDSLRPDHLGCYGYHRNTSPNIDSIASRGVRFENCYTSDAPCLPSRSALFTGQFGIHSGVVGHGGTAADPFVQGPSRGFRPALTSGAWALALRNAGYRTVTVSAFGERHGAWHWYAGWNEVYNYGVRGLESAHDNLPHAVDWVRRHGREENWFLHLNLWDPHTPYRVPEAYGNPFEGEPAPEWLTADLLEQHRNSYGPHSAQDMFGFGGEHWSAKWPRMVDELKSLADYKRWIDGYDTGIRYADDHVGMLLEALRAEGILDDTLLILSADHGENQGELNVYGDHHTADHCTSRVPLIIAGPGVRQGAVDTGLHYQLDLPPTVCELTATPASDGWDGRSFARTLSAGEETGREYLVVSQGAWACQRTVRWDRWLLIQTYDPGLKAFPPLMLFDLEQDPHETANLAETQPAVVDRGLSLLARWHAEQMATSPSGVDPLWTVVREGGPFHTRGMLDHYCARLQATGRGHHAETLLAR
jgi:choline-sulfatase